MRLRWRKPSAMERSPKTIELIAVHCDVCSAWWSRTIHTARERTSAENLFVVGLLNAPSCQDLEPPAAPATTETAAAPAQAGMTAVPASRVMHMNVKNAHGDTLGDVQHVLMHGADHKPYVVIGHGGFLGLGEKQVALPVDSMFMRGNNLVMRGLTDDQIRGMPSWNSNDNGYTDFSANQPVEMPTNG